MTGSLTIKRGKYYAIINIRDEFGKSKPKWISTGISSEGNNKRKAEKALRDILQEYESKKINVTDDKTFSVYIIQWLDNMKTQVEENTWVGYEYNVVKHMVPYFEKVGVTIQDLEPRHIQNYYNLKLKEGLSACTVKHHHANIRKSLQDALMLNIIPYNPADRVKLPKVQKYQAKFYNANQVAKLLEVVKGTPIETPVFLTAFYGFRRSEVLALKWSAIDFQNKTITVNSTVIACKGIIEKERTKNSSSHRVLPLIGSIENHLKELRKDQSKLKLLQGSSYMNNNYVCKWDDGNALKPNYLSHAFKQLLEKNNLPVIRFHDLRHSCASILSASGCDIKKISEWLGHSDITQLTYTLI